MRTYYGVSPWIHTLPASGRPPYRRLRGVQTTDVVIIGGGLTGCAAAYAIAAARLGVIVLERARVGQGSAGRGDGLLLPDPEPAFHEIAKAHGVRLARYAFESWRGGARDAAVLLRRLQVPCSLAPRKVLTTVDRETERWLAREHQARDKAGLPSGWLGAKLGSTAASRDVQAALRVGGAFAFDPYRACLGLAAAAVRRGAAVFEHSGARKIRPMSRGVEVTLEGGIVRASTVVVATGSPTMEFKPLRRHFTRRERYVVVTEPVPAAVRRHLAAGETVVTDRHAPPRWVHRTADHRLVVSGADQAETPFRRREAVIVQRTGQLMYEVLTMYPAISGLRPAYGWDLPYGAARDGLMYAGPHRNYPHHLFALGGPEYSATGAFVGARVLLRALQGRPDKVDAAFAFTR
jgi:glycine/D-amino acid oxidase-like deaminating enzyme